MLEQEETNEQYLPQAQRLVRAALWVSMMDDKGGQSARAAERKALVEMIRRQLRETDHKPLAPVLDYALEHHKAWERWSTDMANLTRELRDAMPQMSLIERQCIYDLAYSVATRYRERGGISSFMAGLAEILRNFLRPEDDRSLVSEYVRISSIEKSALNELADILELPRKIIR